MRTQRETADAALLELLRRHGCSDALRLLRLVAAPAVVARAERLAAVERARELLAAGVPRPAIARRLVAGGASRRSAYRAIEAALCHGPRDAGTPARHAGAFTTHHDAE